MRLKRIITWSLGILIISLLLTEGILRLFNSNNQLFIENSSGLVSLNSAYFARYNNTQCLPSIPFKKEKSENTLRIFVLGYAENAAAPHNPNSSFSHLLNNLLQRSFSKKSFEVINISVNSANSDVQRSIAKQLKKYKADMVVICPGHNEFYGQQLQKPNWINRLSFEIKNSALAYTLSQMRNTTQPADFNKINANSTSFANIVSNFEINLDQTVLDLQKNNVKVVLINSANNLLDSCPQMSCFTSPDSAHLKALYEAGEEAFSLNQFDIAYKNFSEVYKKDKAHAGTCFYLGRLALQNSENSQAKQMLKKAVEHDKIKSRVPSKINETIFKIAFLRNCKLIDVENLFSRYSPNGIPGNNLFLSSQQPNILGNTLIALECYQALVADKFVEPIKTMQPSFYTIAFTPFDTVYDNLSYANSVEGKPAPGTLFIRQNRTPDVEEKIASLFMKKRTDWEDSMNLLYEHYISQKNYKLAFKIIENLALENPYDISVNEKATKTASLLGDSQLVIHYANKVFRHKPGYETAQHLFLNYLKLDMPEDAIPYLEYARNTLRKTKELKLIYDATCHIIDLKKILRNNPENDAIRTQIAQQYRAMGNEDIAMIYFGEAEYGTKKGVRR